MNNINSRRLVCATAFVLVLTQLSILRAQQMADSAFDAKVDRPAYTKTHPKILFDEAHNNFHTSAGRYKPFATLVTNDGYQVTPNTTKFRKSALEAYEILIIANATGADSSRGLAARESAFTEEECGIVSDWVGNGGSLLLVSDHAPYGVGAADLARRFGVDMSKSATADPQNYDKESDNQGFIIYTRESGRLLDHPITRGRDASERISRIITFTGQSLKANAPGVEFLRLADTAMDQGANGGRISAAGRSQGVAVEFGKGRVIVLGEAAMLSAQIVKRPSQPDIRMGMNHEGIDNRQMALNIMHWLSHLL